MGGKIVAACELSSFGHGNGAMRPWTGCADYHGLHGSQINGREPRPGDRECKGRPHEPASMHVCNKCRVARCRLGVGLSVLSAIKVGEWGAGDSQYLWSDSCRLQGLKPWPVLSLGVLFHRRLCLPLRCMNPSRHNGGDGGGGGFWDCAILPCCPCNRVKTPVSIKRKAALCLHRNRSPP